MANIQVLMNENEKKTFGTIADELGFQQSQLALFAVYSLVEMYKKRGSFIVVDLEQPQYKLSTPRNKRVQIICPGGLKGDIESISNDLGYSQAQLCLIAINSFISSYKKGGASMLSDVLSAEYRV